MTRVAEYIRLVEDGTADAETAPDVSVAVERTIYDRIRKLLAVADDPNTDEFEAIRARSEGLALVAKVLNVDNDGI
jgi:hypothetical protein